MSTTVGSRSSGTRLSGARNSSGSSRASGASRTSGGRSGGVSRTSGVYTHRFLSSTSQSTPVKTFASDDNNNNTSTTTTSNTEVVQEKGDLPPLTVNGGESDLQRHRISTASTTSTIRSGGGSADAEVHGVRQGLIAKAGRSSPSPSASSSYFTYSSGGDLTRGSTIAGEQRDDDDDAGGYKGGSGSTYGDLQRIDSRHSLGALTVYNYDPKTTGSLSRAEEVDISLYDQGIDDSDRAAAIRAKTATGTGSRNSTGGKIDGSKEIDDGLYEVDRSRQHQEEKERVTSEERVISGSVVASSTTVSSASLGGGGREGSSSSGSGEVTYNSSSAARTTTYGSGAGGGGGGWSAADQGHDRRASAGGEAGHGNSSSSTSGGSGHNEETLVTYHPGAAADDNDGGGGSPSRAGPGSYRSTYTSSSGGRAATASTENMTLTVTGSSQVAGEASPTKITQNGMTANGHLSSSSSLVGAGGGGGGGRTVSSTNRPRKPGVGTSSSSLSSGSFQIRSAYNSLSRTEPRSPAASDDNFKANLQDTLTRHIPSGGPSSVSSSVSSSTTVTPTSTAKKQSTVKSDRSGGNRRTSSTHSATTSGEQEHAVKQTSVMRHTGSSASSRGGDSHITSSKMTRTESSASQRSSGKGASGAAEVKKKESIKSTTTSGTPSRPPSGKSGKASRTSSTSESSFSSPRDGGDLPLATSSTRSDSVRSSASVKASSIERLAEPKHRRSVERRDSASKKAAGETPRSRHSSAGSSGGGRERKSSQTETEQTSTKVKTSSTSSVHKSDSSRSGSRPGFAATTASSQAKRADSSRSTRGRVPTPGPGRTGSGASTSKGKFSIKSSVTQSASPPGSVFEINKDETTKSSSQATARTIHTSTPKRVPSGSNKRKVTTALGRSGSGSGSSEFTTTTVGGSTGSTGELSGRTPGRTASMIKAESDHRAISKSLFSELRSKRSTDDADDGKAGTATSGNTSSVQQITPERGEEESWTEVVETVTTTSSLADRGGDPHVQRSGTELTIGEIQASGNTTATAASTSTSQTDPGAEEEWTVFETITVVRPVERGEVIGLIEKTEEVSPIERREEVPTVDRSEELTSLLRREGRETAETEERPSSLLAQRRGSRKSLTLDLDTTSTTTSTTTETEKSTRTNTQPGKFVTRGASITTTSTKTTTHGGGRGRQEDVVLLESVGPDLEADELLSESAPLSPLEEARATVSQGTVDRLVKGRFRDLNLTARLFDSSSLERSQDKTSGGDAAEAKPKYKFLVEGIDVPTTAEGGSKDEENKGSFVGREAAAAAAVAALGGGGGRAEGAEAETGESYSVETVAVSSEPYLSQAGAEGGGVAVSGGESGDYTHQKAGETTTTTTTTTTITTGGESFTGGTEESERAPSSLDSAGSPPSSLERPLHRQRRGFTYIRDERLAREVTRKANTVTARRPHEQADRAQESRVSTLERERKERELREARAKLTKAPVSPPPPPPPPPPEEAETSRATSDHQEAFTDVLKGIRARHVSVTDADTNVGASGGITSSTVTSQRSSTEEIMKGRRAKRSLAADMGQFSPDSAYQSDTAGSPAFDSRNLHHHVGLKGKDIALLQTNPEPQSVTVQRLEQEQTVAQGAGSRYESQRTVSTENKDSFSEALTGGGATRAVSSSQQKISYTTSSSSSKHIGTSGGVNAGATTDDADGYVVTTRRNESVTHVGGGGGGELDSKTPVGATGVSSSYSSRTHVDRYPGGREQAVGAAGNAASTPAGLGSVNTGDRGGGVSVDSTVISAGTEVTGKQGYNITEEKSRASRREVITTTTTSTTGSSQDQERQLGVHAVSLDTAGAVGGSGGRGSDVTGKQDGVQEVEGVGGLSQQQQEGEGVGGAEGFVRRYLPVDENGGVHMTIGPEPGAADNHQLLSTTATYNQQGATAAAGGVSHDSLMRIENQENLQSKSVRESHQSSTSSSALPSGASERYPLGNHSSFGSADYSTLTGNGQIGGSSGAGGQRSPGRVIPLAPLTVDINGHNDSFEMATHPASITSPTVKHQTTMYEMSEMTDGAGGRYGRGPPPGAQFDGYYDGPYGGNIHQSAFASSGTRYAPPPRPGGGHFDDGMDFRNLRNHSGSSYHEQTTLSSQQSYRSHVHDLTDSSAGGGVSGGGGFETVSRSFSHIPGAPSPAKYLKMEEVRGAGGLPGDHHHHSLYQQHGGGATGGGGSYRSGIRGYAGRHGQSSSQPSSGQYSHHESYVSRTYVDGPDHHHPPQHSPRHKPALLYDGHDPYDGSDSVKSEPPYNRYTRRSEKILSNRRPVRRQTSSLSGASSSQTLPSRRVQLSDFYGTGGGGAAAAADGYQSGYNTLRAAHKSSSSSMLYSPPGGIGGSDGDRAPVVAPELKDAQKKRDPFGNEYHITLKLNQLNGGTEQLGTSRSSLYNTNERYTELQQRNEQHDQYMSTMSLPNTPYSSTAYHYGDEGYGGSPTRTVTQVELDSPAGRQLFEDRLSWYRARRAQQQQLQQMEHDVVDSGRYVDDSSRYHTFTSTTARSTSPADLTMSIDQTMTMDYVPTQKQQQQQQEQRTITTTEQYNGHVPQLQPTRTNIYITEEKPTKKEQVEEYHEHVEEEWEEGGEPMPQVVRGSILIKNTIDTTGAPKVIDVVADDVDGDEDKEFTVEENTNLFHTKYLQNRENPMYNSDEDLSRLARKPAFTRIFNQTDSTTEEFTEIPVDYTSHRKTRGMKATSTTTTTTASARANLSKSKRKEYFVNGMDQTDFTADEIHERTLRTSGAPPKRDKRSAEMEIARLIRNAPADSVKQRINVEREEEEIMGPLPVNHADGSGGDPTGMLNFDTISEKVDVGLQDGIAQLAVKVRCERIVPIRGVIDLFKKSSVIVTRMIEIDLGVTEERKRLYDRVMRGDSMAQMMIESGGSLNRRGQRGERKLGTKETFKLYKMFMGIAEAEEGRTHEKLNIEQRIEDEKHLPDGADFDLDAEGMAEDGFDFDDNLGFDTDELDNRLESQIHRRSRVTTSSGTKLEAMPGGRGHLMKNPEPDTISYISQASEQSDLLY